MNILKWFFNPDWFTFYAGGGGGAPTQTTSTAYNTNIPEYARPYVEQMLGSTQRQLFTGTTDASGNFTPTGFQPFKPYEGETVAGFSPLQKQAMQGIADYQLPGQTQEASGLTGAATTGSLNAGQQYAQQATNPYAMQAYMSPYIQNALAPQLAEARRQSDITGLQNASQAVGAGAFGGSRFGIQEAERQRNLGQNLANIYGTGMQNAFQNAQQAQQFGSQLGLQGLGQALQGAGQLGNLGQQQYSQELGLLGQQQAVGAQQQAYEQARLNQLVQNYATAQQYPLMQLGVMSNMLRGLPMQASTTQNYQASPSMLAQGAGALGTGLGLYQQYNKAFPGAKEGGVVGMAAGGIATGVSEGKLQSWAKDMSDKDISGKVQDQETDQATKDVMTAEMARRQHLRAGMPKMAPGGIVAFKKGDKVKDDAALKEMQDEVGEASIDMIGDKGVEAGRGKQGNAPDVQGFTGGIAAPAAPVPEAPAPEVKANADVEADMRAELDRLKPIAERPLAEQVKLNQQAREAQGVPSPYAEEMRQIQERRTKSKDEEKEAAQDRLVNFLTRWGTLPGPTLVAMNRAGVEMIEKSELDRKDQRKLLAQLDEAERQINRAEYSRKLGEEDRARQEIKEAGQMYFKTSQDLLKHKYDLAMKDADFKKALAVAKAQSPKGDEYGINVMYEGLVASNPKKYPPGPVTKMIAAEAWQRSKPGVVSTEMGLGYHGVQAAAAGEQASAATQNAKTRQDEERRKQKEDWRKATWDAERMNDDNRAALTKAREKDKAANVDPSDAKSSTSQVKTKIYQDLYDQGGFELLPRPGAKAAAPAATPLPKEEKPKPEPKKAEPKKAESKPEPKKAEPKKAEPKKEEPKKKPLSAFDKSQG